VRNVEGRELEFFTKMLDKIQSVNITLAIGHILMSAHLSALVVSFKGNDVDMSVDGDLEGFDNFSSSLTYCSGSYFTRVLTCRKKQGDRLLWQWIFKD
jgi:hypothetical protein